MRSELSQSNLQIIQHEADRAARRLIRQFHRPYGDLDDLRQELLVDLIARLPAFDPGRGTIGAFAGVVLAHKAAQIARAIRRERRLFGTVPISLDEPVRGADGATRGDLVAEHDGLGALHGQPTDRFAEVDRRLAVERAIGALPGQDGTFCAALLDATPHGLAASEGGRSRLGARSSLYRRMRSVRMAFIATGLAPAWDASAIG
jgi:DNA-directed RNA polymerase specialized sigma24 family protein